MRAFARGLCHHHADSEDLTQETLMKALRSWESYQPGTHMRAWVFRIMRNHFYTTMRVGRRYIALDERSPMHMQSVPASAEVRLHLEDLRRAIASLPDEQREALLLIGASGLTYEAASEICGASVGTLKSRVARGRRKLLTLVEDGSAPGHHEHPSFAEAALSAEAEQWTAPHRPTKTKDRTPQDAPSPDQV